MLPIQIAPKSLLLTFPERSVFSCSWRRGMLVVLETTDLLNSDNLYISEVHLQVLLSVFCFCCLHSSEHSLKEQFTDILVVCSFTEFIFGLLPSGWIISEPSMSELVAKKASISVFLKESVTESLPGFNSTKPVPLCRPKYFLVYDGKFKMTGKHCFFYSLLRIYIQIAFIRQNSLSFLCYVFIEEFVTICLKCISDLTLWEFIYMISLQTDKLVNFFFWGVEMLWMFQDLLCTCTSLCRNASWFLI